MTPEAELEAWLSQLDHIYDHLVAYQKTAEFKREQEKRYGTRRVISKKSRSKRETAHGTERR